MPDQPAEVQMLLFVRKWIPQGNKKYFEQRAFHRRVEPTTAVEAAAVVEVHIDKAAHDLVRKPKVGVAEHELCSRKDQCLAVRTMASRGTLMVRLQLKQLETIAREVGHKMGRAKRSRCFECMARYMG